MKKIIPFFAAFFLLTSAAGISSLQAAPSAQICPVSGDKIKNSKFQADYLGKQYQFCCRGCMKKFKKNPAKFVSETA